jgi:hypothetical protein
MSLDKAQSTIRGVSSMDGKWELDSTESSSLWIQRNDLVTIIIFNQRFVSTPWFRMIELFELGELLVFVLIHSTHKTWHPIEQRTTCTLVST